jgi:hypothetical protein
MGSDFVVAAAPHLLRPTFCRKLTLMGEIFNLLNIANLGGYSSNVRDTANFGSRRAVRIRCSDRGAAHGCHHPTV